MRNRGRFLLSAAGLILAFGVTHSPAQTIPEYRQQAEQLRQYHRIEEAIELLEAGLERHPNAPRLLLPLGLLLIESGRAGEAQERLQRVLSLHPLNPEVHRSLAEACLSQGRLSQAIEHFQKSIQFREDDERVHYRLAFLFLIQEQLDLALEHARRAIDIKPGKPRYRQLYSLLLGIKGREGDSYQQLKIARQLAPGDASILFRLSEKERAAGRMKTALESLKLASKIDPENPLYHSELAQLYGDLGQDRYATEETNKAFQLYQAFEDYIEALTLISRGKTPQALPLLEPAVQRHPEFTSGRLLLADAYQRLDKPQQALQLYLKVLASDPSNTKAMEAAAWIMADRSDFRSALGALAKLPRSNLNQTLIEAYWKQDQQQPAAALERFRRVESKNPLNPELLQWISFCLYNQGQKQEALRYLMKVADLRPADVSVQRRIREIRVEASREEAFRHLRGKAWRAALEAFSQLVEDGETGGRQSSYWLNIAYCHQQLGHLRQAVTAYRRGLQISPGAHWARLNLAGTLYRLSRYLAAAEQWEQIPTSAKTPPIYFQLGVCYLHSARYGQAEAAFRKSLEGGNHSPALLYNLGATLLRRLRPAEAWPLIRRSAAANYPPANQLLRQGRSEQTLASDQPSEPKQVRQRKTPMPPVEIRPTQTILSLDSEGRERAALWLPELVEIGATGERPVFFDGPVPSPVWKSDADSAVGYQLQIPGRLAIDARIHPRGLGFDLSLELTNSSPQDWKQVIAAVCLQLTPAASFLDLKRERTGCVVGGEIRSLADLKTIGGRPEYLFAFVRDHTPQILHGDPTQPGAKWSHTIDRSDDGFLWVRSTDSTRTLWVGWDDTQYLQSNTTPAYGCVHSNPFFGDMPSGARVQRRGRIGIVEGGPAEAHRAYVTEVGG